MRVLLPAVEFFKGSPLSRSLDLSVGRKKREAFDPSSVVHPG